MNNEQKDETRKSMVRQLGGRVLNIDQLKMIAQAAYEWRAAEIHTAACKLSVREDDELADAIELDKLTRLRILLDTFKKL